MKKIFLVVICVAWSLFSAIAWADEKIDPMITNANRVGLDAAINHFVTEAEKARPGAHIGIVITQVSTGKVLFAQRANYLFSPASSLKLFPAVASLHFLGPDFHFDTSLLTNGTINNHVLEGDLVVKFTGDPELTTADVNDLINKLSQAGVQSIRGHVYIDNSAYSAVPYPPGWLWDDLSYGYAAPLNAIIIDRNKFALHLEPSRQEGGHPILTPDIPPGVAHFINEAQTVTHGRKDCPLTIYSDIQSNYLVSGCLGRAWAKQHRVLAVRDPFAYARALIAAGLHNHQINYTGNITAHTASNNMTVLAQHSSPSLSILLREMLKNSDNLTTDSLLKKIGEVYSKEPGSWQNGLHALKKILGPSGIDFKQCVVNDGAGLSRYNLITPLQFVQLLNFAYQNEVVRNALWPAMPIAGQDGTLTYRMQPIASGGRVHAKTGTMTGVSTLAGYVNTKRQGTLSFVVMVNGFVGKARPFKHLQDQICEFLINH